MSSFKEDKIIHSAKYAYFRYGILVCVNTLKRHPLLVSVAPIQFRNTCSSNKVYCSKHMYKSLCKCRQNRLKIKFSVVELESLIVVTLINFTFQLQAFFE